MMRNHGHRLFSSLPRLIALLFVLALCACTPAETAVPADFSNVDFSISPYKHLNNGGLLEPTLPYNIDAITGATLTVEGPGIVSSIPLSVREVENRSDGLMRGIYTDDDGTFIYEGLDLSYLLHDMMDGDNGIHLTGGAYRVVIKNRNRETIAAFTLDEVAAASRDGRPILLAYGVGATDQGAIAPFVFDAANPGEHAEGYVVALDNADGCLKLVYDLASYGENKDYTAFSNAAYVYIQEKTEPGFKHTKAQGGAYGASRYRDYLITLRGQALGCEMAFTLGELEGLVTYDGDGCLLPGGVGYSDFYSLANNAYWYVNEYEGLDLYKLLLYLGMDTAEDMGLSAARTTLVRFVAADGVPSQESFSVDTLSYPDAFGFYNKNSADQGDGSYKPSNADLVKTGYPVLLAYGVNQYPYTITKADDGYLSGLSNSGGPVRVVFGKTQYNHANGSNQVQYLKEVIVGEDLLYNTHKYTDQQAHSALAANTLTIAVTGEDGAPLLEREMAVGEIEDLIYGPGVAGNVKKAAMVKDSYQVLENGAYVTDVYEGVNLSYFLMEALGLPGTNGTVTFTGAEGARSFNLDALLRTGYNTELGRDGLAPLLAFAKNGAPMVPSDQSPGYLKERALRPSLQSEPAVYPVNNAGGPLCLTLPSTDPARCDAAQVMSLTGISVALVPDAYAHLHKPYSAYGAQTVRFYGEGLEREATFAVAELESRQTKAQTLDYSIGKSDGTLTQQRYRGLGLYDLFTEIGIKTNAGDVIVYSSDGSKQTYSLSELKRSGYLNAFAPEKPPLCAMLAFGAGSLDGDRMQGFPLVPDESSPGYDAAANNSGGPLRLIVPQENAKSVNAPLCMQNVSAIEVTANEIDTWGHGMSDVYEEFLDSPFTFTVRNDDSEWTHTFTMRQLESLGDLIVRDTYSVLDLGECEGISIWKFIQRFSGNVPGMENPVSITVYAADGYKNDLLSVFYKEGFELGAANVDGERKPLIIAYAFKGVPLVDDESHAGYTGMAGNSAGPLRCVAEGNQGASVKYANKLVVTVPGAGPIAPYVNQSALSALE